MSLPRLPATLFALLLVVLLAQCESGTVPPPGASGTVTVRLLSPNGAEGGFLVSLPSADVVGVEEGDRFRRVVTRDHDGITYIAVTHRFPVEGLAFELDVADVGAPPEPTLVQVVDPGNNRRDLSGYDIEVVS